MTSSTGVSSNNDDGINTFIGAILLGGLGLFVCYMMAFAMYFTDNPPEWSIASGAFMRSGVIFACIVVIMSLIFWEILHKTKSEIVKTNLLAFIAPFFAMSFLTAFTFPYESFHLPFLVTSLIGVFLFVTVVIRSSRYLSVVFAVSSIVFMLGQQPVVTLVLMVSALAAISVPNRLNW